MRELNHTVTWPALFAAYALLGGCTPAEEPEESPAPDVPPARPEVPADVPDADARPVVAERLPYAEVDEQLVYGHFAIPADMIDPLPAVILIHDWWGLNDEMREASERLAAEGYIVLGVDLFVGRTASSPAEARELEIKVIEDPESAIDNLRQAYDFILHTAGAPRVATIGFGFGGAWSLNAAMEFSENLTATVTYYGQVYDDPERLGAIGAPVLGLFAEGDRAVPPDAVDRFEKALVSLEKDVEVHVYPDARRGFADRLSDNYDATAARDAWERVVTFLEPLMSGDD